MKILRILFFMAAFCAAYNLAAQTTINWQASATAGVANYNVYRAPCTGTVTNGICSAEGTFAKVGATANGSTLTYTDSTVAAGSSYSYYVKAFCSTGCGTTITANSESGASNHLGIVVATVPPQPPVLLNITSAALLRNGANAQLSVAWVDAPNKITNWTFKSGNVNISSGTKNSTTGNYALNWSGKVSPNTTGFTFVVCEAGGSCVSRNL